MDLGLALPQFDYSVPGESPLQWETVVTWAKRAEDVGFASVWLADHLFLDPSRYGLPPGNSYGLSPIVGLAALARATQRVRLGTLVVCAPLRPPKIAARMLSAVDQFADGRLIAGIGTGWFEPEFETAGIPFERPGVRVQQLEDTVRAIKAAEPAPTVWVAGQGDKVMEVAIRHADGFNHQGWDEAVGARNVTHRRFKEFREHCERLGRDPSSITLSALQRVGDVDRLPEQLHALAEEGVATVIVSLGPLPFSVTTIDALDRVASALP